MNKNTTDHNTMQNHVKPLPEKKFQDIPRPFPAHSPTTPVAGTVAQEQCAQNACYNPNAAEKSAAANEEKHMQDEVLSREEAARRIGRTVRTINRYIASGKLRVAYIGYTPVLLWSELLNAVSVGKLGATKPLAIGNRFFPRTRATEQNPGPQPQNGGAQ